MQTEQPQPNGASEQPQVPMPPGQVQQAGSYAQRINQQALRPKEKTSGMAIASLVLGILGFFSCAITGIPGLILGLVSLSAIRKSEGRLGGRGLAISGIVVSGVTILIIPLMALLVAILVPAVSRARDVATSAVSASNVRQLSVASRVYASDHNGQLPDPDGWKEQLAEYLDGHPDKVLGSPYDREAGCGFAMNSLLVVSASGQRAPLNLNRIVNPSRTVLFFEAGFDGPSAGGPELLPAEARGLMGYIICFVDGHVENLANDQLGDLIWSPEIKEAY